MTLKVEAHVKELAETIAYQAEAIAQGNVTNLQGASKLLRDNADTLVTWTNPANRPDEHINTEYGPQG